MARQAAWLGLVDSVSNPSKPSCLGKRKLGVPGDSLRQSLLSLDDRELGPLFLQFSLASILGLLSQKNQRGYSVIYVVLHFVDSAGWLGVYSVRIASTTPASLQANAVLQA